MMAVRQIVSPLSVVAFDCYSALALSGHILLDEWYASGMLMIVGRGKHERTRRHAQ